MRSFKIYSIWLQGDIHTHNFRKCSHASVGFAQARPNKDLNEAKVNLADRGNGSIPSSRKTETLCIQVIYNAEKLLLIGSNFFLLCHCEEPSISLLLLHVAPSLLFTVTLFLVTPTNSLAAPSPSFKVYHYNKHVMRNSHEQNFMIVFAPIRSISTGPTFYLWE